jgi:hypothetical protein
MAQRRDSRGRFAGGGGGKATGGSLKARSSAKRSAAKLAGKDAGGATLSGRLGLRAQRAAVTRTGRASKAAQVANSTKLARRVTPNGTIRSSDVDFARKTNTHVKRVEGPKGSARERFVREKLAGIRMDEQKRLNDVATASAARRGKPAPARTSKAAPNKAKQKYQEARSEARELKMYRGGKSDAVVRKAEAKVARMEKKRRSSRAR